jgi:hypothetical protein
VDGAAEAGVGAKVRVRPPARRARVAMHVAAVDFRLFIASPDEWCSKDYWFSVSYLWTI